MLPSPCSFSSISPLAPKSEQIFDELIHEDSKKYLCDIMLVVGPPPTYTPKNQKEAQQMEDKEMFMSVYLFLLAAWSQSITQLFSQTLM